MGPARSAQYIGRTYSVVSAGNFFMPSRTSPIHSSVATVGLRNRVLAEALTLAQCRSRSGAVPSKMRAPSHTEEPSQMAWVRAPHSGTLPSRHSPSKKVQVCDQSAIGTTLRHARACHQRRPSLRCCLSRATTLVRYKMDYPVKHGNVE